MQPDRIYVDHGLTGTAGPARAPEALAACRAGDTLVVTKPGQLARSLPPKVNGMPMVGYLAERIARGDSGEGWEHWKLVA